MNVHVRNSERIRKSPQRYDPLFGATIEWNIYAVASLVYMIHDGDYDSDVDTDNILFLME